MTINRALFKAKEAHHQLTVGFFGLLYYFKNLRKILNLININNKFNVKSTVISDYIHFSIYYKVFYFLLIIDLGLDSHKENNLTNTTKGPITILL